MSEVFKAQAIGDREIPDLQLNAVIPILSTTGNIFEHDATVVFDALTASLPGGTLDRITVKLLQYRASQLVVAHRKPKQEEDES